MFEISHELGLAHQTLLDNPQPTDAQFRKIAANALVSIAESLETLAELGRQEMM